MSSQSKYHHLGKAFYKESFWINVLKPSFPKKYWFSLANPLASRYVRYCITCRYRVPQLQSNLLIMLKHRGLNGIRRPIQYYGKSAHQAGGWSNIYVSDLGLSQFTKLKTFYNAEYWWMDTLLIYGRRHHFLAKPFVPNAPFQKNCFEKFIGKTAQKNEVFR